MDYQALSAFLDGKKTYIVGGAMIVVGLYLSDHQLVLEGLAVLSGRSAIASITKSKK